MDESQMDESQLQRVSLADLSGLRHEIDSSSPGSRTDPHPEFLVIRYSGTYRDGGKGRGDALYIVATAAASREAWYPGCMILDFRNLIYRWGDEMAWVQNIGHRAPLPCRHPLAIVVGGGCREALQSLLRDKYAGLCVETMDEAFMLCHRLKLEFEQRMDEWRQKA